MQVEILVGPAGWSYADWNGVVYPALRPAGFHEAEYLARYFRVIEINTSFYRPLRPQLGQVWARKLEARKGFRFTAKLYRGFTHEGRLDRSEVRQYCEGLEPLVDAGKLGCVVMQFPWSFRLSQENLRRVLRLRAAFRQYPIAAEMRHVSWNTLETLRAFEDHGISFCNIDQPQLNGCLPPTAHVTSDIGYVRLHGRNYQEWFNFDEAPRPDGRTSVAARYDYLYSSDQLAKWAGRIGDIASKTKTVYVVTNNHFRGQAVVNALEILAGFAGETVETPATLLEHYPELNRSARNLPPQRSLFYQDRSPRLANRAPAGVIGGTAVYARA